MGAATENKGLNDAPSIGTITESVKFAVQAGDEEGKIIQKATQLELSESEDMSNVSTEKTNTWITPKAFFATEAQEGKHGTVEKATDLQIYLKSATSVSVIDVTQIDTLFLSGIGTPTTISNTDVDAASDGIGSELNIYKLDYGNRSTIEGTFTFIPSVNTNTLNIYVNNITQPLYTKPIGVSMINNSGDQYVISGSISAVGTPTSGGGQIKITLGLGASNWVSGATYTIGIDADYASKI